MWHLIRGRCRGLLSRWWKDVADEVMPAHPCGWMISVRIVQDKYMLSLKDVGVGFQPGIFLLVLYIILSSEVSLMWEDDDKYVGIIVLSCFSEVPTRIPPPPGAWQDSVGGGTIVWSYFRQDMDRKSHIENLKALFSAHIKRYIMNRAPAACVGVT